MNQKLMESDKNDSERKWCKKRMEVRGRTIEIIVRFWRKAPCWYGTFNFVHGYF